MKPSTKLLLQGHPMRKVCFRMLKTPAEGIDSELSEEIDGFFHTWFSGFLENGRYYVMAIVEDTEGKIHHPYSNHVRFPSKDGADV
jgi:hypothetical protein